MKYNKHYWLNEEARTFLARGYLKEGMSVEQRIDEIADYAEVILKSMYEKHNTGKKDYPQIISNFAIKFKDYMANGWISLSSPIWANFGAGRGLPISCNSSYIPDTTHGILEKVAEVGMMSKLGSGTSGYFGDVRPRGSLISSGGKSDGAVRFMELFESTCNVISQGGTRRGSFAAYLPVEHGDIAEFLEIREHGNPIQNLSIGVTITDKWMEEMISGDKDKRKIWARIIKKRFATGYPYIFFKDTANKNKPQVYKDKNIEIRNSNLCAEISLSVDKDESFVCCLSSLNLLHYDDWKDTDIVEVMTYFLDAVMEDYIEKTESLPFMSAANRFSKRQRALGLGVLGWHSYLQSKMISFESIHAKSLTTQIFRLIDERSLRASKDMAIIFGEPELLQGYGERNTTRLAIAPTTSSSFILGQVSPSIEPLNSNYFTKGLAKGEFAYRNPFLVELLITKNKNTEEVWKSILVKGGSVQHLDFLSKDEKDVFKTFSEISQKEIIIQASIRQKYIDQGQSLNLMIPNDAQPKEVSELMILAHEVGIKSLYYQRGANPAQELARSILTCTSCEG